jgi:hypothetical protein
MIVSCSVCKKQYIKIKTEIRKSRKEWWYVGSDGKRLHGAKCFQCHRNCVNARIRRLGRGKVKEYEKTKKGFLVRKYRNMLSRVLGIQKRKKHLYFGKEILSKESFYAWADNHKEFHFLFFNWTKSQYDRRLCPTVDRINPEIGYVISNMRWLTHSENSALSGRWRGYKSGTA